MGRVGGFQTGVFIDNSYSLLAAAERNRKAQFADHKRAERRRNLNATAKECAAILTMRGAIIVAGPLRYPFPKGQPAKTLLKLARHSLDADFTPQDWGRLINVMAYINNTARKHQGKPIFIAVNAWLALKRDAAKFTDDPAV